jgi:hypothetical protein
VFAEFASTVELSMVSIVPHRANMPSRGSASTVFYLCIEFFA